MAEPDNWQDAVQTGFVLGTARRPPTTTTPDPVRERFPHDQPRRLLDQVALVSAVRSVHLPRATVTPAPAAPPDDRPPAGPHARGLLTAILAENGGYAGTRDPLLRIWLDACARAGQRIPDDLLPQLLGIAVSSRSLRRELTLVLGRRGQWLAAQHPRWAPLAESPETTLPDVTEATLGTILDAILDDVPEDFPWGPPHEQAAILHRLRSIHPVYAEEALTQLWDAAKAKDRETYLQTLQKTIGPADEPFLEAALDDRSAAVRALAAATLDRLATSRRGERLKERLRPLVTVRETPPDSTVHVDLPPETDAAGIRDGLVPPAASDSYVRLNLQVIVRGCPLETWHELTGMPPEQLLPRLQADPVVLEGIIQATVQRRAHDWVPALLTARPLDQRLLPLLDPAEREQAVLNTLDDVADDILFAALSYGLPGPWSAPFSHAVVTRLRSSDATARGSHRVLFESATHLSDDSAAALAAWLEELPLDARTRPPLEKALSLLSFRRMINEAF